VGVIGQPHHDQCVSGRRDRRGLEVIVAPVRSGLGPELGLEPPFHLAPISRVPERLGLPQEVLEEGRHLFDRHARRRPDGIDEPLRQLVQSFDTSVMAAFENHQIESARQSDEGGVTHLGGRISVRSRP
jgi:hypothetical protein